MGELVVVTGPPGAGKSTVAALVSAGSAVSALVVGDEVFRFLDRGAVEPWRPEADAQNTVVIEAAAAAAGRFVRGGYDVVYDGVLGPWFLPSFRAATGLARLHYALLLPPVEECLRRVRTRTGHEFDDPAATRHMHEQFRSAPVGSRFLVPDGGSAAAVADAVRSRVAAGTIVYGA